MVDFTSTQAQTEELAPLVGQGEAQVETVVAKSPGASPPLTADEVDRMYRQLAEIHAITTAQLADCACWCRIDSPPPPPGSTQMGTSWPRTDAVPSTIRLAPSPPTNFSS
jgi:hypothetical protein